MTVEIKPIRSEADYDTVLETIAGLMHAEAGTEEGDALDVLTTIVEAYEAKHHPIDPPDPIEAIKFRMDQAGIKQADLVPYIGPKGRVSEVLSRKRSLTLAMIRKLHIGLRIPADVLIAEGLVKTAFMQPGDLNQVSQGGRFIAIGPERLHRGIQDLLFIKLSGSSYHVPHISYL